jgi:hypothetical protein
MKKNRKTNEIKERIKNQNKLDNIPSYDNIPKPKPWVRDIYRRIFCFQQNVKNEEW